MDLELLWRGNGSKNRFTAKVDTYSNLIALTTIGITTLTFGTTNVSSSVVRSYEETIKCDPIELMAGNGTFQAVAISNPNTSMSMTIVSGTTTGAVGALISATDNTFLTGAQTTLHIDSSSRTMTSDGFTEFQVSASGWANLGEVD